jgi:hypothetical protein
VEVIGKIFSHVKSVEEVVRASGTCRKWRRAAFAISLAPFDVLCRKDSAVYKNLTTVDLEVLLTQTILQTSSPQNLSPWTEEGFSVAVLISWLLDARDSLCGLTYGLQCFQVLWLTCESVGDIWTFEACPTAAARERSSNGRGFRRSKLAFALVSVFVSGRGISIRP